MQCDECKRSEKDGAEVVEISVWWTAWGRNCFDFNWKKNIGSMKLCEECESDNWEVCECGALIDRDYVNTGHISDDPDFDGLCPECAEKMEGKFPIARRLLDMLKNLDTAKRWVNIGGNWHPILIRRTKS